METAVSMAGMEVSDDPEVVLVTYCLGSCVAVMVHDPQRRVGGMIHYMLPFARTNPRKARGSPAMFADTGVPMLFEQLYALGCRKRDLVVKVAGAARLNSDERTFDIGRRNYVALRQMFWKNDVMIAAEDVGGDWSRTARLHIGSGRVTIASRGEQIEL